MLNSEEEKIQNKSLEWVQKKENYEEVLKKIVLNFDPSVREKARIIFMAGSPGAGKTEFSKDLVKNINTLYSKEKKDYGSLFVRIDVDEIRNEIPMYDGKNSFLIQKSANLILNKIRKHCIENNFSFVNDGTFGNQFSTFDKMISKMIKSKKEVVVVFIFSHPLTSWDFTKKREAIEGRHVSKEVFIEQYFKSFDNIKRVKEKKKIRLDFVLKNKNNELKKFLINTDYESIVKEIEKEYNIKKIDKDFLMNNLK